MKKEKYIQDLKDKEPLHSVFLVKYAALAAGKNNKPYLNLVFSDKTGEMEGRVWEDASLYAGQVVKDAYVSVEGKCQSYQGRLQIVVQRLQVLREDEVDPAEYLPKGLVDPAECYQALLEFVDSMKDPYYRALAESILIEDSEIIEKIQKAPAAKTIHHAYHGGLIEHILSITRILNHLASHYEGLVDRDLLFLGGFLHDIGKIWELSYEKSTDYTTEGKLIGHLVMGVELVDRKIRELEAAEGRLPGPFPEDKKLLVKHLILAHHGKLEYGSPKEPHCLEALIVHMIDDLDSKVAALSHFIRMDQTSGKWTGLNRQFGRFFYRSV